MSETADTKDHSATEPAGGRAADRAAEERKAAVRALDLLAHWWSRPDLAEVQTWETFRYVESQTRERYHSVVDPEDEHGSPRTLADSLDLLAEHERLFVGPGSVPCPPYESYWLEDTPVELRRARPAGATADLRRLYHRLGLDLSPGGAAPDHLAVELEALAYALSLDGDDEVAAELLERHLERWLARFCEAVGRSTEHAFYLGLAALTLSWLAAVRSAVPLSRDRPRARQA